MNANININVYENNITAINLVVNKYCYQYKVEIYKSLLDNDYSIFFKPGRMSVVCIKSANLDKPRYTTLNIHSIIIIIVIYIYIIYYYYNYYNIICDNKHHCTLKLILSKSSLFTFI